MARITKKARLQQVKDDLEANIARQKNRNLNRERERRQHEEERELYLNCLEDMAKCAEESLSLHLSGVADAVKSLCVSNAALIYERRKQAKATLPPDPQTARTL